MFSTSRTKFVSSSTSKINLVLFQIFQASNMTKRKKTHVSEENEELSISKAKKTQKKKNQATRDCNLEKPAEASDSSNTLSKPTIAEAVQECKEHSLDSKEMEILPTVLDASSVAEENKKTSPERKEHAKSFESPSQDMLESSEAECLIRNAPSDTAEKLFQSTAALSESQELMDLSVKNKEGSGDQEVFHCEETLDIKIQNQDGIISMNNGDAVPGFIDSQLEKAQKPVDIPANISDKQKIKGKKRVSFFLTPDAKDAKGFEERELSPESLERVKRNENEEAPEAPALRIEHGTKNRCEKLPPIIKQSKSDTCDLKPNEISEALSKKDADEKTDGKEKAVMCGGNKFDCVERGVSSAEIISPLDGAEVRSESNGENSGSEAQGSLLLRDKGSSTSAVSTLNAVTQMCSAVKDPHSVELDFLLDSQLQGTSESNHPEHPPHKPSSLDIPYTGRGTKSIANVAHPDNARDETVTRVCDPSKEEDATKVVCGLIKELSNLNRLVMSTHRDLDAFKRQKFRRYRQSGKLLPHSMDTITNVQYTIKKKKKMSLANTITNFNIRKDFLCSSDVSSAGKSKAVVMHGAEADV